MSERVDKDKFRDACKIGSFSKPNEQTNYKFEQKKSNSMLALKKMNPQWHNKQKNIKPKASNYQNKITKEAVQYASSEPLHPNDICLLS